MVARRFPHSASISWKTNRERDPATGRYTEGIPITIPVRCRVEQVRDQRTYLNREGNAEVNYEFKVFYEAPEQAVIPTTANFIWNGRSFPIIKIYSYQYNDVLLI